MAYRDMITLVGETHLSGVVQLVYEADSFDAISDLERGVHIMRGILEDGSFDFVGGDDAIADSGAFAFGGRLRLAVYVSDGPHTYAFLRTALNLLVDGINTTTHRPDRTSVWEALENADFASGWSAW